MQQQANKKMQNRIIFLKVMMILMFLVVAGKSFDIQIFKAKRLARMAENDYSRHIIVKGERGQILDRDKNKLATSTEAVSITACPKKIKSPATVAEKLSKILDLDRRELQKDLSSGRGFTWVARRVSPDQARQVKRLGFEGINFEKEYKRNYPNRGLAAQIVGFTGSDDNGLEGLEFKYNHLLEGRSVKVQIKQAGNGGLLDFNKHRQAQLKGKSIVLTLDKKIQFFSEKTLEDTVERYDAKSGMALVMRPKTGEFLAIAHYPKFNPNNFSRYNRSVFRNRAVTDAFEPGSAMKVFTAAAALENGFTPKTIFFCENGTYRVGTFTIHDTHPHDWLSINQIIKYSSNIGSAKIIETIGDKALYTYLDHFGFGRKTHLGSPGETAGSLLPYRRWSRIDAAAISFGQGVSVSAVQLVSAVSAIANGGMMMKPMLIKEIISNTGEVERSFSPLPHHQVVSPDTAEKVKYMMSLAVTEEGTGSKAAMDGYKVCGKTGTAQKVRKDKKGYSNERYTAVFAGFAPMDDPKLAILIVVDEPLNKYHGGEVAAPAFKAIMADSFHYLNIPPQADAHMIAFAAGEKQ